MAVEVGVGVEVAVALAVVVAVEVADEDGVAVSVGEGVGVIVRVGLGVIVGVDVAVGVDVGDSVETMDSGEAPESRPAVETVGVDEASEMGDAADCWARMGFDEVDVTDASGSGEAPVTVVRLVVMSVLTGVTKGVELTTIGDACVSDGSGLGVRDGSSVGDGVGDPARGGDAFAGSATVAGA